MRLSVCSFSAFEWHIVSRPQKKLQLNQDYESNPVRDYINNPERKSKKHEASDKDGSDYGRKHGHRLGDGEAVCERRRVRFHHGAACTGGGRGREGGRNTGHRHTGGGIRLGRGGTP